MCHYSQASSIYTASSFSFFPPPLSLLPLSVILLGEIFTSQNCYFKICVFNSMELSILTMLNNHCHYLFSNFSFSHTETLHILSYSFPVLPTPFLGKHLTLFPLSISFPFPLSFLYNHLPSLSLPVPLLPVHSFSSTFHFLFISAFSSLLLPYVQWAEEI